MVGSGAGRRRRRVARLVWISQRSRATIHCTRARVLDHSSDSPMERRAPHGAVEMHTRAGPHKCVQRCSRHRSRGLSRSGPSGKRVDGVPARPHPRPSRNACALDSPAPLPSPAPFPPTGHPSPFLQCQSKHRMCSVSWGRDPHSPPHLATREVFRKQILYFCNIGVRDEIRPDLGRLIVMSHMQNEGDELAVFVS